MPLPNPMLPLLERLLAKTFSGVEKAGRDEDADRLSVLTSRIQDLERTKRQSSECWRKLCEIEDRVEAEESRTQAPRAPIEIRVAVTKSNLDNGMLLLTAAVKVRALMVGQKMRIETPQKMVIETDVVRAPARLRARKAIREFFAANKVNAGDSVRLRQLPGGHWLMERV